MFMLCCGIGVGKESPALLGFI